MSAYQNINTSIDLIIKAIQALIETIQLNNAGTTWHLVGMKMVNFII